MGDPRFDTLSRFHEVFNAFDATTGYDEYLGFLDPAIEWEALEDAPDAGTYRGHEGIVGYLDSWRQLFDGLRFDVKEMLAAGDGVATDVRVTGRMKGSASVESLALDYAVAYRFAGERIVRAKEFRTLEQAGAYLEQAAQSAPV